MRLLFCGTAAAEGWPALFCVCAACQTARQRGGPNVRTRAATMIGERVRIDFGPDSYLHQLRYGLAYERLEHLLVTHSHEDHWYPHDLSYRRSGFSVVRPEPLHVWGNADVRRAFERTPGCDWRESRLAFHRVAAWKPIDLGQGVSATPILAAHAPREECVNYIVESGGRQALIGHDTGWYAEPTWSFLAGRPLDLVALDCTYGPKDQNQGHLGCTWVVRARDELDRIGALAKNAIILATHFSHNGGWLHDDLVRYFEPHGIGVAYDGLTVEL